MATATQSLPRDEVAVAGSAWHEVQEGCHGARRTIAVNGYVKVPEDKVAVFEELSGLAGTLCRCIARHRPTTNDPPPAIRWVPRRAEETGPGHLAR
eukprot:9492715-Alexandrium_andersonii.AAC.1